MCWRKPLSWGPCIFHTFPPCVSQVLSMNSGWQNKQNSQIKHSACSGLVMLMTITPSCLLYATSGFFDLSLIGIVTTSLFISSCTCNYLIYLKMYQKEGYYLYFTKYMQVHSKNSKNQSWYHYILICSVYFSSIFIFKLYTCTVYCVWRMGWIPYCYKN